jgi:acetylornithine deacetylase/succinyl-diaminopimelate desuccinylase-like protein
MRWARSFNVKCSLKEENRSRNLMQFFDRHKDKLKSDVIVVCDTENVEVGMPCITYSLRGIVTALVEVQSQNSCAQWYGRWSAP